MLPRVFVHGLLALGLVCLGSFALRARAADLGAPRLRPASAFRLRFLALAADPAHGGQITKSSFREAYVGLRLERRGLLPGPIRRDPTGGAEFYDRTGTRWDVKGFSSEWPISQGGFLLTTVEKSIAEELATRQNLILDRRALSAAHDADLHSLVGQRGWQGRVLWYPTR